MTKAFSLKDRARFMKKLSFLLGSGIPFLQTLDFVMEREEKKKIKKYLTGVTLRIRAGMPIHKSFAVPPLLIDMQSLRLVENGEMTGSLAKNCKRCAEDLESKLANRNRLISALIYPAFILFFAFALILFLLIFVFPKILSILDTGNSPLPLTTRILLGTSLFLKNNSLTIISIALVGCISFYILFKRSHFFKRIVHRLQLTLPVISKINRLISSYLFAKLISLFLESGYALSESLYHAERLEKNLVYKNSLKVLVDGVRRGERFSKLVLANRFFPRELGQFAALGEESGNLSKTLFHVAQLFEEELHEIEKRMFALLEPALMLILGMIVGFIALSLITPIYSLTASLSQTSP